MSLSKSPGPTSHRNRFPISLNHRLDQKLLGYAAAASAAGVGMMALAQPSQAEIVYTPTRQTVPYRGTLALDLNNDGVTDFTFHNNVSSCGFAPGAPECSEFTRQKVYVIPEELNGVAVGSRWAPALPADKNVGPGNKFGSYGSMAACNTLFGTPPSNSGPWHDVQNRYLGLAFSIDGQTHYGWARLSVFIKAGGCKTAAVLTGYAYETVPGKPIATGKTSGTDEVSETERPDATLGALALGSVGFEAWRRDEDADGRTR